MLRLKPLIRELRQLIEEYHNTVSNYLEVRSQLDIIQQEYQAKKLNYTQYTAKRNKILDKKSDSTVESSYKKYCNYLQQKIELINNKIAFQISKDTSYTKLRVVKKHKKKTISLPSSEELFPDPITQTEPLDLDIQEDTKKAKPVSKEPLDPNYKVNPFRETAKPIKIPQPKTIELKTPPKPKHMNIFKRIAYAFQAKHKPWLSTEDDDVMMHGFLSKDFFRYILLGREKHSKSMAQVLPNVLNFDKNTESDKESSIIKADVLDPHMLEKQIKELKGLISKKKPDVYRASTLGYLANISVRLIAIYFIEQYPGIFKELYRKIRHANMKIMASTYINITFFMAIVMFLISLPIFTVIFAVTSSSAIAMVLKIILASSLVGLSTFGMVFYYPYMKADSRRRSINTNLPFAIDHMASVISSGVSPATMFKLISNSDDYGEVSVEVDKVSNYVDFFGYDIITALKAVSLTTPSKQFKDFFDGFVSSVESGGDLKDYLAQKSSEALLNYRLERQQYVESLSTYSDLYTGVLIAAPLLFVVSLSLIAALGGTIGGLSVSTINVIGTYLLIPGLNIIFLIFLEINQPEI